MISRLNIQRAAAVAVGIGLLASASYAGHGGLSSVPAKNPLRRLANTESHRTSTFAGVKANTGYATHETHGGKSVLTLSDDFKVPDAPAPHWQVVDPHGHTYLLQRLVVKGDKLNKTIEVPDYVHDIARVQIWCAYAEVLLGEASFSSPVK